MQALPHSQEGSPGCLSTLAGELSCHSKIRLSLCLLPLYAEKADTNRRFGRAGPCIRSLAPLRHLGIALCACRQVAAQSKIFISAGFETTALTLTYCIYLLSKHPEHQARLQQEVDGLSEEISYEDLQRLPYTAAVVNESLRLYPPATTIVRRAGQNIKVCASCSILSV